MNGLNALSLQHRPTAQRPLLGQSVLVVEDSRYTSDALRLLCLKSGARMRRADTLAAARTHLRLYRPTILIVDLGLPDGSGVDLVREMVGVKPQIAVILGISGDLEGEKSMRAAGAHEFLIKPIESLIAFQQTILRHLPATNPTTGLRLVGENQVSPDRLALQDDLAKAAVILSKRTDPGTLRYVAPFVAGLARSAHDTALEAAARAVANHPLGGQSTQKNLQHLHDLMCDRLEIRQMI